MLLVFKVMFKNPRELRDLGSIEMVELDDGTIFVNDPISVNRTGVHCGFKSLQEFADLFYASHPREVK